MNIFQRIRFFLTGILPELPPEEPPPVSELVKAIFDNFSFEDWYIEHESGINDSSCRIKYTHKYAPALFIAQQFWRDPEWIVFLKVPPYTQFRYSDCSFIKCSYSDCGFIYNKMLSALVGRK